jgi:hypothetical protein
MGATEPSFQAPSGLGHIFVMGLSARQDLPLVPSAGLMNALTAESFAARLDI